MFQERKAKPRRPDTPIRIALVLLSRLFNWRDALVVVQPQTLVRWHRQGIRLFWRWKSRPGRPPIPTELRQLIREMAMSNPSWGEERIANELLLKLGIRVSPRTVRIYMQLHPWEQPRGDQRWSTFVRNHASAILACDFCVVVTATFRLPSLPCSAMKDLLILLIHLLTTIAKLLGPGGVRAIVADSLLMKQQLLVINRSRRRAPNLSTLDRFLFGFWSLFLDPRRIQRAAVILPPSTLLRFHDLLINRKTVMTDPHRAREGQPLEY